MQKNQSVRFEACAKASMSAFVLKIFLVITEVSGHPPKPYPLFNLEKLEGIPSKMHFL